MVTEQRKAIMEAAIKMKPSSGYPFLNVNKFQKGKEALELLHEIYECLSHESEIPYYKEKIEKIFSK